MWSSRGGWRRSKWCRASYRYPLIGRAASGRHGNAAQTLPGELAASTDAAASARAYRLRREPISASHHVAAKLRRLVQRTGPLQVVARGRIRVPLTTQRAPHESPIQRRRQARSATVESRVGRRMSSPLLFTIRGRGRGRCRGRWPGCREWRRRVDVRWRRWGRCLGGCAGGDRRGSGRRR